MKKIKLFDGVLHHGTKGNIKSETLFNLGVIYVDKYSDINIRIIFETDHMLDCTFGF